MPAQPSAGALRPGPLVLPHPTPGLGQGCCFPKPRGVRASKDPRAHVANNLWTVFVGANSSPYAMPGAGDTGEPHRSPPSRSMQPGGVRRAQGQAVSMPACARAEACRGRGAALRRGELPRDGEDDTSWGGGLPDRGHSKGQGPEDASLVQGPSAGQQVCRWCLEPAVCRGPVQESAQGPPRGDMIPLPPVGLQCRVMDTHKPAVLNSS